MKTIATIAATLLLSLGLSVAPASADEAAPGAVWTTPLCDYAELAGRLNDMLLVEKANVVQANDTAARMARVADRRKDKISDLRGTIRDLRNKLRATR